MKHIISIFCIVILAFSASGCYTLNMKASPTDHPISLSNQPKGKIIKHFTITKNVAHLIIGLVNLNDIDVSKEISKEIEAAGGSEAINVKVTYQMTFVNGLLNMITIGIYNPLTLEIEGDIAG
jgi:hypothetical protein